MLELNTDLETTMTYVSGQPINFARVWWMPSVDTFDIRPIGELVKRYLAQSKVSVDPFARNKRWATYTNDLNPKTEAEYHLSAEDFLGNLVAEGLRADLVIFDPPYSVNQIKENYDGFGLKLDNKEAFWIEERNLIYRLLPPGGYVITCGWSTNGMGLKRQCLIKEIMLVAHGGAHNDTIVMVEQKIAHQMEMAGF